MIIILIIITIIKNNINYSNKNSNNSKYIMKASYQSLKENSV